MDSVDTAVRNCHFRVRWSPRDATWIASVDEYPQLRSAHEYSRLTAINDLKAQIRRHLGGERTEDRSQY